MKTVSSNSRNVLEKTLNENNSPLFLSRNVAKIKLYLKKKGFDIKKDEISAFIAEKKSASITRKNFSTRKIAEKSAPFNGPQKFFQVCHSDLIVLSKNRSYNSSKRYVLVLVDGLSSFTYLQSLGSTKSENVIQAFEKIFGRSEYLPEQLSTIVCDFGVEYVSSGTTGYLKNHGIKVKPIGKRLDRQSKGATIVESKNREIRQKLETLIKDEGLSPLDQMLIDVENAINNEPRGIFGELSSKDMLYHDPKYVAMLKASNRMKRHKSLRKNIEKPSKLPLYCIVRIKKNSLKEKLGNKESYGVYSESMFIVLEEKNRDFVNYYIIGNLYDLKPVSKSTFSFDELVYVNITYEKACYIDSINTATVLRRNGDFVEFQPKYCSKVYYANKALFGK